MGFPGSGSNSATGTGTDSAMDYAPAYCLWFLIFQTFIIYLNLYIFQFIVIVMCSAKWSI